MGPLFKLLGKPTCSCFNQASLLAKADRGQFDFISFPARSNLTLHTKSNFKAFLRQRRKPWEEAGGGAWERGERGDGSYGPKQQEPTQRAEPAPRCARAAWLPSEGMRLGSLSSGWKRDGLKTNITRVLLMPFGKLNYIKAIEHQGCLAGGKRSGSHDPFPLTLTGKRPFIHQQK